MVENKKVWEVSIAACLLEQNTALHLLSMVISVVSLMGLLIGLLWLSLDLSLVCILFVVLVLGVLETYLSVRVGFDAKLLKTIVNTGSFQSEDLKELDHGLYSLGLTRQQPSERTLGSRLTGSLRLFRFQKVVCGLQGGLFFLLMALALFMKGEVL